MSRIRHSNPKKGERQKQIKNSKFTQRIQSSALKTITLILPLFKWFDKRSEAIRNWLIAGATIVLAIYTYRLFETAVSQTDASIDILQNSVRKTENRQIIVTAEIINTSQITPAEDLEIQSRFDLREKDFDDDRIVYTKPIKEFPLVSVFSNIKLRDTLNISIDELEKVGISLWPFLHMRFKYDNGFGEQIITNFGFSYDINNTNEAEICKHTYKE